MRGRGAVVALGRLGGVGSCRNYRAGVEARPSFGAVFHFALYPGGQSGRATQFAGRIRDGEAGRLQYDGKIGSCHELRPLPDGTGQMPQKTIGVAPCRFLAKNIAPIPTSFYLLLCCIDA